MDVRDNSTSGDGGLDQGVQLLVSPDGELKMPWRDPLHLEVLGGVSGQLQNLGGEVLEDGSGVHGGGGTDAAVLVNALLEETVDTTDRELQVGARSAA